MAMDNEQFDVAFVMAGDTPQASGVYATQLLDPARHLAAQGHRVTFLCAIPLLSYLKDIVMRLGRISTFTRLCVEAGIGFEYVVVPLGTMSPTSFIFRKPLLALAARTLSRKFLSAQPPESGRPVVLQARSYYGTHLALNIKAEISCRIKALVSFDMRSLFPEEFPLTMGPFGTLLYGFAKQWEYLLLKDADVSFLPLEYARQNILVETGIDVEFAPIQGFDRETGWEADFEGRWRDHRIGFAGSLLPWHDPGLLKEIITGIPGARGTLATKPLPELSGFEVSVLPVGAMKQYYDSLLAMVVPGQLVMGEWFVRKKMRCNAFSTKASEALTRGVPLIVSAEMVEIADFVRKHDCGAIYDPVTHRFCFPEGDWLSDKAAWESMTRNAVKAGEMFMRSNVMDVYLNTWKRALNRDSQSVAKP